jgi:hypothetical protein
MTAKQKAAREKFKKVVAEAQKLRKKNPSLTQAQAVKQAFAISYSKGGKVKKVGAIKKKAAPKKKATPKKVAKKISDKSHKDTKSHNVNIRVVSGLPITKGDYLVSTWGYDQTNVDFFYVVKIVGSFVYIVPASQQVVELGDMQGKVIPKEAKLTATPIRRKIKKYTGGEYVKIDSISYAKKWDGKPVYYSSYA